MIVPKIFTVNNIVFVIWLLQPFSCAHGYLLIIIWLNRKNNMYFQLTSFMYSHINTEKIYGCTKNNFKEPYYFCYYGCCNHVVMKMVVTS